jgi:hypothetical protein
MRPRHADDGVALKAARSTIFGRTSNQDQFGEDDEVGLLRCLAS